MVEAADPGGLERRIVTVLFCDLAGFTTLSERLDAEDVAIVQSAYFEAVRDSVARHGGTVEKFIGDAAVAVYGVPIAGDRDAEQAVRSGLAIVGAVEVLNDRLGLDGRVLDVRVGVNTGDAVVHPEPAPGEPMVTGDVVNTAARLQAAAPLNGVLVGEQTRRATEHAIDYRAVEPVLAKGKSEPVRAWEAVEARSRLGVDVAQTATVPLVGRERELGLVVSALARVSEERAPQLVTLVGVPGIGKSRLVHELLRIVDDAPDLVTWRQGRSLPYGDGVTFWALSEIVKAQAGILETDTSDQAQDKLSQAVEHVGATGSERQWLERQLRPLAGLADVHAEPGEAFAAWRRFLEALAEPGPAILVFEDLHWADDALLDFVDHLVDRSTGVPLLVLGTARPEFLERRPGWGGGKPNALTVSLSPLSDDDTARIVEAMLGGPALAEDTQGALVARASGNPLYAEQYARMLLDGGDVSEFPGTVQGIIAARLDALAPDEKRVLQAAAVVGKVFWLGAVEAVETLTRWQAEELLHSLERKEFVRRQRRSAVAGETEYAFGHVLIRDVAYSQIPRAGRSDLHERAARWIQSLGRPEDHAEMLAHHHLQAIELAEAAGLDTAALGVAAREALRNAGDRAAALCAVEAAERFYDAALRLWPRDDPERAELLLRRAVPVRTVGAGDPARLAEVRDAFLEVGDSVKAGEAEMLLSDSFWIRGHRDLADEHQRRAAALVAGAAPSRASAWVLVRRATRALLSGDPALGVEIGTQVRDMAQALGWDEGQSIALGVIGSARIEMGDPDGLHDVAHGIEIAAAAGALGALANGYNTLAVSNQILGDLEAGYRARLEGAEVAERLDSLSERRWFASVLVDHRYRRGEWDEALRAGDEFIAAIEAGSPHYNAWQLHAVRAEMRLARDDASGAAADAERALAIGRTVADPQAIYFVLASCAHVLALTGDVNRAIPLARELLDALRRGTGVQFAVIELPAFTSVAAQIGVAEELAIALQGRAETRWTAAALAYLDRDFSAAADILRSIGARPEEAEARLRSAERLSADGRLDEASNELRQSAAFFRFVGATRYLRECEALSAAPV